MQTVALRQAQGNDGRRPPRIYYLSRIMLSLSDTWTCDESSDGTRLDKYLSAFFSNTSRSRIQEWITQACFKVNGKPAKKNAVLRAGDTISVSLLPEEPPSFLIPEDIPLDIVHEDDSIIVINKPKGMVVHPGSGNRSGTLVNALAYRFESLSDINDPMRPGILHRLDKGTSGLLLAAKTNKAHLHLARQLQDREIKKTYEALVWMQMTSTSGIMDLAIGRHPGNPVKMAVANNGKEAVTHWEAISFYTFATHLRLGLETGRTHQIRVHLSHANHPIMGDTLYGGSTWDLNKLPNRCHSAANKIMKVLPSQALHAGKLEFLHPDTEKPVSFSVPLTEDFKEALRLLEEFRDE